jgi:hypothetical protein
MGVENAFAEFAGQQVQVQVQVLCAQIEETGNAVISICERQWNLSTNQNAALITCGPFVVYMI